MMTVKVLLRRRLRPLLFAQPPYGTLRKYDLKQLGLFGRCPKAME